MSEQWSVASGQIMPRVHWSVATCHQLRFSASRGRPSGRLVNVPPRPRGSSLTRVPLAQCTLIFERLAFAFQLQEASRMQSTNAEENPPWFVFLDPQQYLKRLRPQLIELGLLARKSLHVENRPRLCKHLRPDPLHFAMRSNPDWT